VYQNKKIRIKVYYKREGFVEILVLILLDKGLVERYSV
jgi:hypothetical protein